MTPGSTAADTCPDKSRARRSPSLPAFQNDWRTFTREDRMRARLHLRRTKRASWEGGLPNCACEQQAGQRLSRDRRTEPGSVARGLEPAGMGTRLPSGAGHFLSLKGQRGVIIAEQAPGSQRHRGASEEPVLLPPRLLGKAGQHACPLGPEGL